MECRLTYFLRFSTGMVGAFLWLSCVAQPYTQLIDSNLPPPPVAPEMTNRAAGLSAAWQILSKLGPWVNKVLIYSELEKQWKTELALGLAQAEKLGLRGVLLEVRVLATPTAGETLFTLRDGKGVLLVNVGNDADSICYASKCFNTVEVPIAVGSTLTSDSGYVFIVKTGDTFSLEKYQKSSLEARARQIRLNTQMSESYAYSIRASALDAYAQHLATSISEKVKRESVDKLIADAKSSRLKIAEIERQLTSELQRAERAAKTSATLQSIALYLNLASSIAMATSSLGEDVVAATGQPVTSKAELLKAVESISAQAGENVKTIRIQQQSLRDSMTGLEASILTIGVEYGMPVSPGSVLKPYP